MPTILKANDDELWALCIWREARGESPEAKLAVAQVIHNRTTDLKKRWTRTIREVILQPKQFSSFNSSDPNYTKFPAKESPVWKDCQDAVAAVKAGAEDPVKGANHYHSMPVGKPWPKWAKGDMETAQIGPFRFYRL